MYMYLVYDIGNEILGWADMYADEVNRVNILKLQLACHVARIMDDRWTNEVPEWYPKEC